MIRVHLFLLAALVWSNSAVAGMDTRWAREGADSWGKRIAAQVGVPGFGRSIAVVIAVGDYRNGWPPIEAAPYDAARMSAFFKEDAEFDIVYTITDEKATRQRIRELMVEELPDQVESQDRIVFYFSGHGTQREQPNGTTVGHLVLADSSRDGWASMIDMRDIERWWEGISNARQSLFLLDSCFSGLGLQSKSGTLRDRTLAELSKRGHHLMTAGTADQESYANVARWGGSLFTTALLDGMRGRADSSNLDAPADGIVSLKELWDYVGKRITEEKLPGSMSPQMAGFGYDNPGEFFFIASGSERTEGGAGGSLSEKGGGEGARSSDGASATRDDKTMFGELAAETVIRTYVDKGGQVFSEAYARTVIRDARLDEVSGYQASFRACSTCAFGLLVQCSKPVDVVSDLHGLRIRTTEPLRSWIMRLQAEPVPMAYAEVYSALQLDVIDCYAIVWEE